MLGSDMAFVWFFFRNESTMLRYAEGLNCINWVALDRGEREKGFVIRLHNAYV